MTRPAALRRHAENVVSAGRLMGTTVAAVADEPFHAGERSVQERVAVRDRLAAVGRHAIRDFMPDQHRDLFSQLPFVIAGTVDAHGQPWASVLAGPPGFIASPDPRRLEVHARALAPDSLRQTLEAGAPIGLLGLEPHTRRRNRLNGIVAEVTDAGFSVRVQQSFGNCPKYIQAREARYVEKVVTEQGTHRGKSLDDAARQLIRRADTLLIASAYPALAGDPDHAHGVDVSHRGGNPGFVRIDPDGSLTVPDFVGNFFFNTLGNLESNPRAGLLFIDFECGDLLYVAVDANIIWGGAEVEAFAGAQRLLRFRVRETIRAEALLPLRWGEAHSSPFLEPTGAWPSPEQASELGVR